MDWTGITSDYAKGVNCVIDNDNKYDIHIQLPTITKPATDPDDYKIQIYIESLTLAPSSICSF